MGYGGDVTTRSTDLSSIVDNDLESENSILWLVNIFLLMTIYLLTTCYDSVFVSHKNNTNPVVFMKHIFGRNKCPLT